MKDNLSLGVIQFELLLYSRAVVTLRKVIDENPKCLEALFMLG
jgi:hypothetical protein